MASWQSRATLSGLAVTAGSMITIGAPSPRANWYAGSSQTVSFTLDQPVENRPVHDLAGEQRRHLVLGQPVKPVAGQSSYSVKVPASVPAATGYQLVVRWRADPAVATWQSRATLSGLAVAADPVITIGAPSSGASWATGKSYTVSWTIDQAVWAASSSMAGEQRRHLVLRPAGQPAARPDQLRPGQGERQRAGRQRLPGRGALAGRPHGGELAEPGHPERPGGDLIWSGLCQVVVPEPLR